MKSKSNSILYRPMLSRSRDENHRTSTTLELLLDLCFVVAIGAWAKSFQTVLISWDPNKALPTIIGIMVSFFGIWWCWLQFSWFASAYDVDDALYRIAVFVQMAGVLIIAAGVEHAFAGNFKMYVLGYVLIRISMVSQWFRAFISDQSHRKTNFRYFIGIFFIQIYWVLWVLNIGFPKSWNIYTILVGVFLELSFPIWAEHAGETSWHRHHIAERYGLFTIIVLGESVLEAVNAIKVGGTDTKELIKLVEIGFWGLVLVFGMWWVYFDRNITNKLTNTNSTTFIWGYGHVFLFASAAAVGSGLDLLISSVEGRVHSTPTFLSMTIAVPLAIFLLCVWLFQVGPKEFPLVLSLGYPIIALLIILCAALGLGIASSGILLLILVSITLIKD